MGAAGKQGAGELQRSAWCPFHSESHPFTSASLLWLRLLLHLSKALQFPGGFPRGCHPTEGVLSLDSEGCAWSVAAVVPPQGS